MGNMHTQEYANAVREGQISLDLALHAHLGTNHFPPLPEPHINVAKQALDFAAEEEWDGACRFDKNLYPFPADAEWDEEGPYIPAWKAVQIYHLAAFLETPPPLELDEEWVWAEE